METETFENGNNNNSESEHSDSYSPVSPKLCYGCKKPIEDKYRLCVSPDLDWHISCLVCSECHMNMDENWTCFLKEGKTYCKKDYVRLFGMKCSSCLRPIPGNEQFMRAKDMVYHTQCFCCSSCDKHLLPGDMYGVNQGKLICKSDLDLLSHEEMDSPDSSDPMSIENYNGSNGTDISANNSLSGSNNSGGGATTKRSNSEKGPRVRTVLSEQQLQTLKTVYSNNPRPDALMKEHLVEITGLNPRVIRVWFQNKRCKDKKKLIQNEAVRMQQLQGGSNSVLPPLTPQTPLTPDSMGQISPHQGMPSFTYPPAPSSYDVIPSTPTHTAVSPIVSYQQNQAWASPTTSGMHFDHTGDYSSPITTAEQNFVYSTAITSHQTNFF